MFSKRKSIISQKHIWHRLVNLVNKCRVVRLWKRTSSWKTKFVLFKCFVEMTVFIDAAIADSPLTPNVRKNEPVVIINHSKQNNREKAFVIIKIRATVLWVHNHYVFPVCCSKTIWELPSILRLIRNLEPFFSRRWKLHIVIFEYFKYCLTDFRYEFRYCSFVHAKLIHKWLKRFSSR